MTGMSKKFQLSIPTPCHENWDNMTKLEKGKFCGSCQKQVIDFSNMSDREIAIFFKKKYRGSVCGRFMEGQLDRSIEIPKKRIPWVKYFFQIMLPAFLVTMKATAQGKIKVTKVSTVDKKPVCSKLSGTVGMVLPDYKPILKGDTTINAIEKEPIKQIPGNAIPDINKEIIINLIRVKGKIVDDKGFGIPYATVIIKGTKIGTACDTSGNFIINVDKKQNQITLVASCVGFETIEKSINPSSDLATDIIMQSTPMLSGEVVVAGYTVRKKARPELKNVPLLPKIKQTPFKFFRLYPNPIKANTLFTIEWKKAETGNYILELFDQSGQLTFSKEIWIGDEEKIMSIQLPSVASGNYFLRMTNKNSGKSYTEKIIVQ